MNEFEIVEKTTGEIIDVLNKCNLSGMTIFYMLGNIQNMVKEQIMNSGKGEQNDTGK